MGLIRMRGRLIRENSLKGSLLFFTAVLLSACNFTPKDPNATLAFYQSQMKTGTTSGVSGQTAFQNSFYAFAVKNCVACHGSSQNPLFAVANVGSAYTVAKNSAYVNFTSVSSSKLVTYSGNGHCGTAGCAANAATAAIQVQAWADAELAAGNSSTPSPTPTATATPTGTAAAFISPSMLISNPLPTGTVYKVMRWNLSQILPANTLVANAIFEIEVQLATTTTYRVRNPRIIGLASPVKVTGIHVYVKPSSDTGIGVEDTGAGSVWASTVANAPASPLPSPLPTEPVTSVAPLDTTSLVIGVRSNQDSFTIGFDKLEAGAPAVMTYTSIRQNLLIPKCVDCHGSVTAYGGVRYDTYAETMKTVILSNTGNRGRLYLSTLAPNPSMPLGSAAKLTPAESAGVASWIDAGAPNN